MTGYPVIMNGDHAEFEAEWAASGKPDHERPDWPLPSFDAVDWARAFLNAYEKYQGDDFLSEDIMIAWFANALMRGYDERRARLLAVRPVCWRVKDHADGWVICRDEQEALHRARSTRQRGLSLPKEIRGRCDVRSVQSRRREGGMKFRGPWISGPNPGEPENVVPGPRLGGLPIFLPVLEQQQCATASPR